MSTPHPPMFLATLCLNEMEWLPRLYEQHKDWPGLVKWVFVEAADKQYQLASPEMVTDKGLSVDGTTEWLEELEKKDDRVKVIRHGFCGHKDPAQGKIEARNAYLREADKVEPKWIISIDADEFYIKEHQAMIGWMMMEFRKDSFIFHRREIWRPPSIAHMPLLTYEVIGGFWAIPCCHWWRWYPNSRYGNHNTIEERGRPLTSHQGIIRGGSYPQMVHFGFASQPKTRLAKNAYYAQRGEGKVDHRAWYVESRAAWRDWSPHPQRLRLPRGARVIPYRGPVPEVFASEYSPGVVV